MTGRDRLRAAEPWLWAGAFAALLVPLVLGAAQRAVPGIDSDVLVPWRIAPDVFAHGTDVAWGVGGPTFVFPDFLLFLIARWVAPEIAAAYTLYAGLQFALLAAGASLLLRECAARRDGFAVALGTAVAAAYLSAVLVRRDIEVLHLVFFPVAHQGMVAAGMLYLALAARVLRGAAGRATLVLLAVVAGLSVLSDALSLPQFLLPGVVAAVVFARGRCEPRAAAAVVVWTAGGVAFGLALYIGLDATSFWHISMSASSPSARTLSESLRLFLRHLPGILEWTDVASAALAAAALAWAARLPRGARPTPVAVIVLRTLALAWVITFVVPALGGRWGESRAIRYVLPVWFLPLAAAAVVAAGAASGGLRRALLAALLAACGGAAASRGALSTPPTPYPDIVRDIDAAASAHGVTEGIATYWYASLTTVLTRKGVRLTPVNEDGGPEVWLTNSDWFFDGAPDAPRWPEHRLIVVADATREGFRRRVGEPAVVVPLPGRFDGKGVVVELWLRPAPGPPFDTAWMQDAVLGATIATGLRSIDPRLARGAR